MGISWLNQVKKIADLRLEHSCVPYSGTPGAAVAVLSDGCWIPGVRVETASFSLVIPAVLNAVSTAVAIGRRDVRLIAVSGDVAEESTLNYLEHCAVGQFYSPEPGVFVAVDQAPVASLGAMASPFLQTQGDKQKDVELAGSISDRAYTPASAFPVACIATSQAYSVPGVNVEHSDWSQIICAERNAIGTLKSYGLGPANRIALSCPEDPSCSPCGACRQVIAELAPNVEIVSIDAQGQLVSVSVEELLPHAFTGATIRKR